MAVKANVSETRSELKPTPAHATNDSKKYFLDCDGVPTTRMAGKPGTGHVEVAKTVLGKLEPGSDVYDQMFALGFVRVLETDAEVFVDALRPLTKKQQAFLSTKRREGKAVSMNDATFIQSRSRAA